MKASNVLRLIIGLSSNQGVSQEPEEDETDLRTQRVVLWTSFGILLLGAIIALGIRWLSQPIENDASDAPAVSPLTKIRKSLQPRIKPPAAFVETSVESGIRWTQENGAVGKYFPEAMGTGVAWVDWDNDLADLILISSTHWPENASVVPMDTLQHSRMMGPDNFVTSLKSSVLNCPFMQLASE